MTSLEWVAVLDSSSLIASKKVIAARLQWRFFESMKVLVQSGQVCFPKAVRNELQQARHVDTPEAWALDACDYVQHSYDPDVATVAEVMQFTGDVVDADAEGEPADPYVLAKALEIQRSGRAARVVTEEHVDRLPIKISMVTACERLGLNACNLDDFLTVIAFEPGAAP